MKRRWWFPVATLVAAMFLAATAMAGSATKGKCTRGQAKAAVEKMAGLLSAKGRAGLAELRRFRFCRDNYVWAFTPRAVLVVNPTLPKLEGQNVLGLKDDRGKQFYIDFLAAPKNKVKVVGGKKFYVGSGWAAYRWYRIGGGPYHDKCSYIRGVIMGTENIFLGAGVYDRCP